MEKKRIPLCSHLFGPSVALSTPGQGSFTPFRDCAQLEGCVMDLSSLVERDFNCLDTISGGMCKMEVEFDMKRRMNILFMLELSNDDSVRDIRIKKGKI